MISLERLPPDVLGLILGLPDMIIATMRLWRCGCRLLMVKLANSVTEADMRPLVAEEYLLPRMLLDFRRLRKLSLHSLEINLKNPNFWLRTTESLPGWLEVLEISSTNASHAFLNYAPGWTKDTPLFIETQFYRGPSNCWDIGSKFPRLESLKVENFYASDPFSVADLFPALPSTLTHFSSGEAILIYEPPFASLLPESLRILNANLELNSSRLDVVAFDDDWSRAPPGLDHIDSLVDTATECAYTGSAEWIPRAVHNAQVVICSHALDLPSHLESLIISHCEGCHFNREMTADWAYSLPPTLKSLGTWSPSRWAFHPSIISNLPRTLTFLDIGHFVAKDWETFFGYDAANEERWRQNQLSSHLWPPGLETMWMALGNLTAVIGALPATIKTLELDLCVVDEHEFPTHLLPPQLTKLSFKVTRTPLLVSAAFPNTLTDVSFDLFMNEFAKWQTISNLPSSVTRLSISSRSRYSSPIHHRMPWRLPPHLRKLEIHVLQPDWLKQLPQTLEHLVIHRLVVFNSRHFYMVTAEVKEEDYLPFDLSKFPPHLSLLRVAECEHPHKLIPPSFVSLPSLTSLYLPFSILAPSATLKFLPQAMESLTLLGFRQDDDNDLSFFPPHIYSLNLGATKYDLPIIGETWPIRAIHSIPPEREKTRRCIQRRLIDQS